jgi:hypothetical protein
MELNFTLKEKVKAAVVKRYNANLKALDLPRFHTDPGERMVVYNIHRMLIHILCAVIYFKKTMVNRSIQLYFTFRFGRNPVYKSSILLINGQMK